MARFGLKEVADVTFINISTGKPELFFDTLKVSNIEMEAEQAFATGGRGGGRILGWDYNRTSTLNMTDALLSELSLSMLAGNSVEEGAMEIFKREVLVAVAGGTAGTTEVTLAETPVSSSSTTYTTEDGGKTHGTEVTASTEAQTMVYADTDVPIGQEVVVYYNYSASAGKKVKISADKYPAYYKVIGDTIVRDEVTGVDEGFQFVIPKAKLQPAFTLTMDAENVSTFDFNLDVFKDDTRQMIEFIRY